MFIILSEVIGVGSSVGIFAKVAMDSTNKNSLGKVVFIATIVSFAFGFLLGLICGIDLYPDDGGNCCYCGEYTNWKYRSGRYICYSCDKN